MSRSRELQVERHLDGVTVTFAARSIGLVHLLMYCAVGAGILTGALILFLGIFLWQVPPIVLLVAAILGALVGGFRLGQEQDGGLANFLAQSVSARGGTILVSGLLSERRIPMVDVIAFDQGACMVITRDYRTIHLALSQPDPVRQVLAGAISEVLPGSPDGTPEDVPEAIRHMNAVPQKPRSSIWRQPFHLGKADLCSTPHFPARLAQTDQARVHSWVQWAA